VDVTAVLSAVHVPTLVVANTHDRILPIAQARYVATNIPDARMVEFDGMDSAVHYEHPGEFLALIDDFYDAQLEVGESDRGFATVVFSDIVGSTERLARLGDQAWHELLRSHDSVTRRMIERHGGTEIKSTGDGFFASFTDPGSATRYGLELVAAVRALGIEVRVGIHAGEVQHNVGDDVSGMTVHAAARICSIATANDVLVSDPVRGLAVDSGFTFTDWGLHELRGAPGSWRLYSVTLAPRHAVNETVRLATGMDRLQQAVIRRAPVLGRIVARIARRAHNPTSA
jgi:class 3 adenylate cyclase